MIVTLIVLFFALCLVFVGWHLDHAKKGYEDETGFHYGEKK